MSTRFAPTDHVFSVLYLNIKTYMVKFFFIQVIFLFVLFELHKHTLPYPETKEKQKLPEIKN